MALDCSTARGTPGAFRPACRLGSADRGIDGPGRKMESARERPSPSAVGRAQPAPGASPMPTDERPSAALVAPPSRFRYVFFDVGETLLRVTQPGNAYRAI